MMTDFAIHMNTEEGFFMQKVWNSECVQNNVTDWARIYMMDDCAPL